MISIRKLKNSGIKPKNGLFQLSHKVDYGLFLLIELAKSADQAVQAVKEPISLRTIAEKHQMSFFFLQKIALDLKRAGLIEASRGKNGGYVLAKTPAQLKLKDVLEALEGPIAVMHCLTHAPEEKSCVREGWCTMRSGLNSINQILIQALEQTTLNHLLNHSWKKAV